MANNFKQELEQLIEKFQKEMKEIESKTESRHLISHSLKKSEKAAKRRWQNASHMYNCSQDLYDYLYSE